MILWQGKQGVKESSSSLHRSIDQGSRTKPFSPKTRELLNKENLAKKLRLNSSPARSRKPHSQVTTASINPKLKTKFD